jgi:N-methylhydantoinase B
VERKNILETIGPGETITNMNPGGGGYGNPYERPIDKVVWDVKNGLVSLEGAHADYGVVITDVESLAVDHDATSALRGGTR